MQESEDASWEAIEDEVARDISKKYSSMMKEHNKSQCNAVNLHPRVENIIEVRDETSETANCSELER